MIEKNIDEGILSFRLNHGKANALDLELLHALSAALQEAASNTDIKVLTITGTGSVFSAGVDLKRILDGGSEYANRYIPVLDEVFEQLFSMPKPVVAAINGHAIAGGCILALACDYKLMAAGKGRIGVPELKVGVPFPASAFEIVRYSVPNAGVQALMYRGETMLPEDALASGLVDEITVEDELQGRAEARAKELAAIPVESFTVTKHMLRSQALAGMREKRAAYGEAILDRWAHEQTYAQIKAYMDRTIGK